MIDAHDLQTIADARRVLGDLRDANEARGGLSGQAHIAHDVLTTVLITLKVFHDEPVTDAHFDKHSVKA